MGKWLVKLTRYTGGESVVGTYDTKAEADAKALEYNTEYQCKQYWVEKFDPEKFFWPGIK